MGARTLPKMGTLFFTTLALCSSLLVSPSSAYAPTPALARTISSSDKSANSKTGRYSNGSNVGHFSAALDAPSGGGGGSGVGSPAQLHTGSRGRLLEAVGELRGGSPATKFPGYDTAAAAIAAISIPAATLTAGPALFVQGVLLSLLLSIDGFRVREHFVSYGYGFSVAVQAAGAAWLFRDGLHTLSKLHVAGLVAYGLRLVLFCRWRDSLPCFQNRKKRVAVPKTPGRPPYAFWGICSMLYALLALPSVYVLRRLPAAEGLVGVSQAGLATMAAGLLVEAVADWQKSRFKKKTPDGFCSSGLFRFSRHPNYFGETVFWSGVWLAATPSFAKWYHWVFATIGPTQIVSIILRATKGLEKRQEEKYGSSKEWKEYKSSTPVLVPGTRQYTWEKADKTT